MTSTAFGEVCGLSVNREACPGKESEAFPPQGNPTSEPTYAQSEAECASKAEMKAKIVRQFVIKKITVSPTYEGNSLSPVSSEGDCGMPQSKGIKKRNSRK